MCAFSGFSATSNNRKGGAAGELTAGEAGADDAEVMVARNEVGKMNIRVPYKSFFFKKCSNAQDSRQRKRTLTTTVIMNGDDDDEEEDGEEGITRTEVESPPKERNGGLKIPDKDIELSDEIGRGGRKAAVAETALECTNGSAPKVFLRKTLYKSI